MASEIGRRRFLLSATGLTLGGVGAAQTTTGPVPSSYFRGEPLRIGNQLQFLMDDYLVEDRWMLTRKLGKVIKHLRNPVVVQDKPWEEAMGAYPCVLHDPHTRKYRMWYQCFSLTNYFARDKGPSYFIGYAESDDAYNWTKPALEGFPFGGYERTNIVTTGRGGRRASAPHVFLNPDQSNPKRRYVMVYMGYGKVDLAYSSDGLHWDIVERPLANFHTDFPNHLVWVPEQKLWYMYMRPAVRVVQGGIGAIPEGLRHIARRLAFSVSSDLVNWSMPRTIMYPDERDEPDYDMIYVFRRHGLFIALYSQMQQEPGLVRANGEPSKSQNQVYLATSRDGLHWERTWDRQPFIPRGREGSFDAGQVEPSTSPPVEAGPDLLMYYYAAPYGQSDWFDETGIGLCRMRRDRFIAQCAGDPSGYEQKAQTGYLVTRQFVLEGSAIEINYTALPGPYHQPTDGIRVGILEPPDFQTRETSYERTVPGFALEDCDRMVGDGLGQTVKWKGSADLSRLKGRGVYLRFQMKKAGLYGFRVLA
ncbi:MAG: hypothetical protein ACKV22_06815 [Bryobacteraceae bacterium]